MRDRRSRGAGSGTHPPRGPLPERLGPRTSLLGGVLALLVCTFLVNALLLVQPIYMLQMYDRVLASASVETLLYISLMAGAALLLLGLVDAVRSGMASRIAARLEVEFGARAFLASMKGPQAASGDVQPLRDLQAVRGFVTGRGIFAFLDLPFAPFFIAILLFVHPALFWLTVVGAGVLAAITLTNQWASNRPSATAALRQSRATLLAQAFARNVDSLGAMGMTRNALRVWGLEETAAVNAQDRLNGVNAMFAGMARAIRLGLQIAILGYGSYLVLAGQMSAGMIFAASLISGRGLQPIDQVIGGWKGFVEARRSWTRLRSATSLAALSAEKTELPALRGEVTFENVVVLAAGSDQILLKRIGLSIPAGRCVAIIGRSGAGKSTLVRALVGAIDLRAGVVRIDGADIRNWDAEALGRQVGYLSQDVELLPGTIARNISRFEADARDEAIVAAATKAGVHSLIQQLPNGYDTVLGAGAVRLSGGQRQRIGLARALYGNPKLLVLDEPNAHLDDQGELALENAIIEARKDATTVVIVTQRRSIVERADGLLVMRDGEVEDYGPREEVLKRQARGAAAPVALPAAGRPAIAGGGLGLDDSPGGTAS